MGLSVTAEEVESIFEKNEWNYERFRMLIVIKLGEKLWINGAFDELWLFGDGNLKIIKSLDELKIRLLNKNIVIKEDYFRVLQSTPIGWYIG